MVPGAAMTLSEEEELRAVLRLSESYRRVKRVLARICIKNKSGYDAPHGVAELVIPVLIFPEA
jgi:hypothetical protein